MLKGSFWQLLLTQAREFYRQPGILFWAIGFPVAMSWVLGVAFTGKQLPTLRVAVLQQQGSQEFISSNQAAVENLKKNGQGADFYDFQFLPMSQNEIEKALKQGRINIYLEYSGQQNKIIYHFDDKNDEGLRGYLLLQRFFSIKNGLLTRSISPNRPAANFFSEVKHIKTTGSRFIDFLVPGIIAMGIMNSCMWGIGWALVELRAKKLLRRIVATPMRKMDFMNAVILTRIVISFVESAIIYIFAHFYFDTVIQGSLWGLTAIFLAANICFGGIAILIASRTETSRIGNAIINAVTMPMMILSGIFFSYHNFPDFIVSFIQYLPLTLTADSIRGIFIEGYTFTQIILPTVILTVTGILGFAGGLKIYKWY